jgi:type VI secretion system secreted protein Hcp
MAVDMFLKLDGIKGESTDAKHPDEIQIDSFSFGQASELGRDTGQRAGRVSMQDFHFVMSVNKATPQLMLKCAKGEHILEGLLTLRKPGAQPLEFLKIKFADIIISSFQNAAIAADAGQPKDQFSLWFAKIEFSYYRQNNTGGLDPPDIFVWDRVKGV